MANNSKKMHDFVELVLQMRQAQKDYFRDRSQQALSYSKELERRVDKAASDILNRQGKLLDYEKNAEIWE